MVIFLYNLFIFICLKGTPKVMFQTKMFRLYRKMTIFLYNLYIFVCLKVDPRSVVSKQKCSDYIEILLFMGIFLYNLYIFRLLKGGPKKCCIETKMFRLYRNITIYGHFSI